MTLPRLYKRSWGEVKPLYQATSFKGTSSVLTCSGHLLFIGASMRGSPCLTCSPAVPSHPSCAALGHGGRADSPLGTAPRLLCSQVGFATCTTAPGAQLLPSSPCRAILYRVLRTAHPSSPGWKSFSLEPVSIGFSIPAGLLTPALAGRTALHSVLPHSSRCPLLPNETLGGVVPSPLTEINSELFC